MHYLGSCCALSARGVSETELYLGLHKAEWFSDSYVSILVTRVYWLRVWKNSLTHLYLILSWFSAQVRY